jgi:hypothetical protein
MNTGERWRTGDQREGRNAAALRVTSGCLGNWVGLDSVKFRFFKKNVKFLYRRCKFLRIQTIFKWALRLKELQVKQFSDFKALIDFCQFNPASSESGKNKPRVSSVLTDFSSWLFVF